MHKSKLHSRIVFPHTKNIAASSALLKLFLATTFAAAAVSEPVSQASQSSSDCEHDCIENEVFNVQPKGTNSAGPSCSSGEFCRHLRQL